MRHLFLLCVLCYWAPPYIRRRRAGISAARSQWRSTPQSASGAVLARRNRRPLSPLPSSQESETTRAACPTASTMNHGKPQSLRTHCPGDRPDERPHPPGKRNHTMPTARRGGRRQCRKRVSRRDEEHRRSSQPRTPFSTPPIYCFGIISYRPTIYSSSPFRL